MNKKIVCFFPKATGNWCAFSNFGGDDIGFSGGTLWSINAKGLASQPLVRKKIIFLFKIEPPLAQRIGGLEHHKNFIFDFWFSCLFFIWADTPMTNVTATKQRIGPPPLESRRCSVSCCNSCESMEVALKWHVHWPLGSLLRMQCCSQTAWGNNKTRMRRKRGCM